MRRTRFKSARRARAGLGDQIAVLEGFDLSSAEVVQEGGPAALEIAAGGTYSGGSSWEPGIPTLYGHAGLAAMQVDDYIATPEQDFMNFMNSVPITLPPKTKVIDPSGGANYTGGGSFSPGLPLLPSTSGLAGAKMSSLEMKPVANPYAPQTRAPGYQVRRGVIDPSAGANYGGGSSFAPGLPLLPSDVGLAAVMLDQDAQLNLAVRNVAPGFQTRRNVIDPSAGANYSGGSDYAPGLPLLPSSAGLAGCDCGTALEDLAAMDLQARQVAPDVFLRTNVIDPSGGANYTGGGDYAPGLPLITSYSGLAAVTSLDGLDGAGDNAFRNRFVNAAARAVFERVAGAGPMRQLRVKIKTATKAKDVNALQTLGRQLAIARAVRRLLLAMPKGRKLNANEVNLLISSAAVSAAAESTGLSALDGRIAKKIKTKLKKATKAVAKVAKPIVKVVKPFAKIAMTAVGIPPLPYAKLAKTAVKGVKAATQGKPALRRFAQSTARNAMSNVIRGRLGVG